MQKTTNNSLVTNTQFKKYERTMKVIPLSLSIKYSRIDRHAVKTNQSINHKVKDIIVDIDGLPKHDF